MYGKLEDRQSAYSPPLFFRKDVILWELSEEDPLRM